MLSFVPLISRSLSDRSKPVLYSPKSVRCLAVPLGITVHNVSHGLQSEHSQSERQSVSTVNTDRTVLLTTLAMTNRQLMRAIAGAANDRLTSASIGALSHSLSLSLSPTLVRSHPLSATGSRSWLSRSSLLSLLSLIPLSLYFHVSHGCLRSLGPLG